MITVCFLMTWVSSCLCDFSLTVCVPFCEPPGLLLTYIAFSNVFCSSNSKNSYGRKRGSREDRGTTGKVVGFLLRG